MAFCSFWCLRGKPSSCWGDEGIHAGVRGDDGIHARVGQAFWDDLVAAMSAHFRRGEFTEGLVFGIGAAAEQLAIHFPYDAKQDVNELPDDVDLA